MSGLCYGTFFFLRIPRPPRSTRTDTLLPYTTLFRSAGMTLTAGQTLAEVNGLGTVWLNAAVPEAIAGPLKPGQTVRATLAAFPGEILSGRVSAILPQPQADSRTLTVLIELPNRSGRLRDPTSVAWGKSGAVRLALGG